MVITRDVAVRVEGAAVAQQIGTSLALAAADPDGHSHHLVLAGGALLYGGPGMYVNRGIGLGVREPVTADHLDQIEAFYDRAGADAELELNPLGIEFEVLIGAMADRGWSLSSLRPTFLLGPGVRSERTPKAEEAACFRTVDDDASLTLWQGLLATGFGQTQAPAQAISETFSRAAHRAPGAVDLIIELGGQEVGACSVTFGGEGVAWLGGMAVLPSHRGRGLQRAALDHRVSLAFDAGCDLIAVGALHGGASSRNVQRAGFSMAWTNVVLRRPFRGPR